MNSTPDKLRVSSRIKLFHGLGSIAYGIKENGFSMFVLLFYNQVLGMDAKLVSAALAVAMIIDAFADPIIGHMSDRTRSRWGRRLPWLYLAAVPLGVSWMLLWYPVSLTGWSAFFYLVVTAILVRTMVSACEVPSMAVVPELTPDYDERTRVMRIRLVFAWLGGIVMLGLAYAVFGIVSLDATTGQLSAEGYWRYGLTGGILMAVTVLVSARGQHDVLVKTPVQPLEATGVRHAIAEIRESVSHPAYVIFISALAFSALSAQVTFVLSNYLYLFVWQFSGTWMKVLPLMLFFTIGTAYLLVARLHIRFGKRETALYGIIAANLFWMIPYLLMLTGIWPHAGSDASSGMAFLFFYVANTAAIVVQISMSSMIAEIVEASQEETGRRSEGLFYAGNLFIHKCATGFGLMIGGLMIDFAGLAQKAAPGKVPQDVLDTLAISYISLIALLALGMVWRIRKFPISREDHAKRLERLGPHPVA
jgi:glycoside/pentoside/hexuronide:cation symporter, GPH family